MRNALLMRLLAGLSCLLLAACFDIREEVWIERNGAGRAELTYTLPESALLLTGGAAGLEKKVRELVAGQPPLTLDGVAVTVTDGQATVNVRLSTESMLSLLDLQKSDGFQELPQASAEIAGHFDVRLRGLDIDFARTVRVREALGLASLAIGAEDREARRLSYTVHLPKAAKEHNATAVADGGKTLVWESTLGDALEKPVITRFRATMPVPLWVWVAAAFLAGGIAVLLIRLWKKFRAALS
jgi:hypothetical protein